MLRFAFRVIRLITLPALAGAIVSPLGGLLADRIGFRPVLVASLVGGGVVIALTPFAPRVELLAVGALAFAGSNALVGAMVFALLATEVPPERRSATLNLVYLPLYAAGFIGPFAGAVVVSGGLPAPFLAAAAILIAAAIALALRRQAIGRARSDGPV